MIIYKVDSADMAVTMTLADSIDNGAHPVMQRTVQCIAIKHVLGAVAASVQYCFCQQLCLLLAIGRTSVDIGASAKLELVDKFCYLGDMLSVDGDADAAVEARIRIGWNKFRQLVPLLTVVLP